jgi:hypothetical protein
MVKPCSRVNSSRRFSWQTINRNRPQLPVANKLQLKKVPVALAVTPRRMRSPQPSLNLAKAATALKAHLTKAPKPAKFPAALVEEIF